jgi:hypothetical protein
MDRFFTGMLALWPELHNAPSTGIASYAAFEARLGNITPRDFGEQMARMSSSLPSLAGFTFKEACNVIHNIAPIAFAGVLDQYRQATPAWLAGSVGRRLP